MFSLKIKKKGICRIIIGGIVYSRQIMLPKNASMLSYEEISVLCFYKSIHSMIPFLSKINCIADLFYMITMIILIGTSQWLLEIDGYIHMSLFLPLIWKK